ncbi:carboxymuconolactone decarboxylase [Amycolatopsis viridis]|uniref:Alkylhydroperoxidase/carboxymuconolactone decarboxylase family protein YurZ n=1 Tax=Amycolatopsis viridis TaxID=185678 RepID=A0ABX0SZJ7_9PSEU|nr:carboxymuconolactone decarboxylase [Amycolatopsis viridis]NIH81352.1 alkylhydroperoxidase/carboxymuconolactone decarboxylase family protein YurZ [Amycolatopsis viridis]
MSTTTEAPAGSNLERLAARDPVFAQMVGATARHARAIPELTEREKTFLCVVADVCQASLGFAFEAHVRTGLDHGVSTADIRALLRFISYDCGYHAATAGLQRLAEFEAEHGVPQPAAEPLSEDLVTTGPGAAPSPLPPVVRAQLSELDDHFLEHFDMQSRMRSGHGPGTLSERERGFASLSIDVHYQTLEETFQAHVGRALRGGASRDDVRAALRFNSQFGVTRTWQAWKALNALFAAQD